MNEANWPGPLVSTTALRYLCCLQSVLWFFLLLVCGILFGPVSFLIFYCLIVLVQSQSLSRRTTPFAPRVQVMGPVWRAQCLSGLCSLTVDWPSFFSVPILWNAFSGGKWQLQVSPLSAVHCVIIFPQFQFHGITVMMTVSYDAFFFNPLISSFSQEVHAQLIWTHYQRHSSVARWGTAFDPPTSCVAFGTAGNAGGCFSGLFKTKDLASLLSQCDLNPGPANPHTPLVDGSAGSCCSEEIPSHRIVLKSHFPLPVMS